jgi:hypothetical protein
MVPVSLTYVTPYQVVAEFRDSIIGVAQCIARSTAPQTQISPKYVQASAVNPITITGGSVLTIATLSTEPTMSLYAQFVSPIFFTPTAELEFTFGEDPSFLSPWRNTNKLFINGKIYTTRTAVVSASIVSSGIDSASPFYFSRATTMGVTVPVGGTDPNRIRAGDVFVLLASAPYETTDRVMTQMFDITDVGAENAASSSYQTEGSMYINSNIPRAVYPSIKIVN